MRKKVSLPLLLPALLLLALCGAGILTPAYPQSRKPGNVAPQKKTAPANPFGRPAPTRPLGPVIPQQNRYQEGKVFLERADSLYTDPLFGRDDQQILKGNVQFRQGDMYLYCDSAYYFPAQNSMDAFGNVRMVQGATSGFADVVYYDGNAKLARMRTTGHQKVKLRDATTTLTTDSLDYSLAQELGWFNEGGSIFDGVSNLSSWRGKYSPATHVAEFEEDVVLTNKKDGYRLSTQRLVYNTRTHIAEINDPTEIVGRNDVILTSKGRYNTQTDNAVLESRSTIEHRDSAGNTILLEGDSITYDKASGVSEAFAFSHPDKGPRPVVITDTAHRAMLIGNYGRYDNVNRVSVAAGYPLLKEYSRGDTIFLRADTIRTRVLVAMVLPDDVKARLLEQYRLAYKNGADTLAPASAPSPVFPQPGGDAPASALVTGSVGSGSEMNPALDMSRIVNPPLTPEQKWLAAADSSLRVPKDYYMAQAWRRARFFRSDVQGVADTIRFNQLDSMLYMVHRPVVWSGERQVAGNRIDVHLADSTADWAFLPDFGIMSEHVEDEFYNQMSGKRLFVNFDNGELVRLEVDGNVRSIFLPAEHDSTFNKLVDAQSSYLTMDFTHDRRLQKLKMWPDVSGTVTPIFLCKKNLLYLPGFQILESIRPRRGWYSDGSLKWDDELGDVPDDLERYLDLPPLSGRASGSDE